MILAVLLSLALAVPLSADKWDLPPISGCGTVEVLNPSGPELDMVDWTTLDADLRATSHMQYDNGPAQHFTPVIYTVVAQDRITYLKNPEGDTWDVNVIDDDGIWAWRTENAWYTPRSFKQMRTPRQALSAPRKARGGFPGTRWFSCGIEFGSHVECAAPTRYGHLGYAIGELYGPYPMDFSWGDGSIGKVDVIKVANWYYCTSLDTSSCGTAEVYWYTQRYGWINWILYERRNGVMERTPAGEFPRPLVYLVPGTVAEVFPCDQEMP